MRHTLPPPSRRDAIVLALVLGFAVAAGSQASAQTPGNCTIPAMTTNLQGGCGLPAPVLTLSTPAIGAPWTISVASDFPFAPLLVWATIGQPVPYLIPYSRGVCAIYYRPNETAIVISALTDANDNYSVNPAGPLRPDHPRLESALPGPRLGVDRLVQRRQLQQWRARRLRLPPG